MNGRLRSQAGGTLIVVLLMVAILALAVGAYYQTLVPKFRTTYQGSSWQEALHGAEAGADFALRQLDSWAETVHDPDAYAWSADSWSLADPLYPLNGARALNPAKLPVLGGQNHVRVTSVSVDVYTREAIAAVPTYRPWFRIRSTARADLPGRYIGTDRRDSHLRRMKLGAKANGAPDPHVTRTVEIIAAPRYRFNRAITTVAELSLANSNPWRVDSFDSSDPEKSEPGTIAGGVYPASRPDKIQSNGGIGSALAGADATTYGPLIAGNGAVVLGDVQTFGGDNPATTEHENVSGSQNMDQNRIHADFDEDIQPEPVPVWNSYVMSPNGTSSFAPGTVANPARYYVGGNLGTFSVTAPPPGTTGCVEILVSGHLNTGNGVNAGITIPPNVNARLYIKGDIDLGNGKINANASSSQVASHLSIYGVGPSGTYVASGNNVQVLTFYGPQYDVTLNGTVETHGAMVAKSLRIFGGGNGGFHYDEALSHNGDVVGWRVTSYFEDVRSDL
jgi:hypothetical protein